MLSLHVGKTSAKKLPDGRWSSLSFKSTMCFKRRLKLNGVGLSEGGLHLELSCAERRCDRHTERRNTNKAGGDGRRQNEKAINEWFEIKLWTYKKKKEGEGGLQPRITMTHGGCSSNNTSWFGACLLTREDWESYKNKIKCTKTTKPQARENNQEPICHPGWINYRNI